MSETLDQTVARLTAFIQENNPSADVAPGSVFSEQVLKVQSSLQNLVWNDILSLASAQSILVALANNSTVPDIINQVASNFDISPSTGTMATGNIKIVVSVQANYVIPSGFTLTQPATGLNYVTTEDYYIRFSNPTAPNLPLYSSGGTYYFILPVVAAAPGSVYSNGVINGTLFTLGGTSTLINFVSAQAYGGFTAGQDIATNAQVITQLKQGISTRTLTTPISIQANLTTAYPSIQDIAVIGAGDSEMTRSLLNGVNTFGMADVYIRTSTNLESTAVSVTPSAVTFVSVANAAARYNLVTTGATLGTIATQTIDGTSYILSNLNGVDETCWLPFTVTLTGYNLSKLQYCIINDTTSAGFYNVSNVIGADGNNINVLFTGFDYDNTRKGRVNNVPDRETARFTSYQTAILVLNNLTGTATATVNVNYQPYIANIQNIFLSDDQRIACADYLVKAVTPCFVSANLILVQPVNVTPLDTATITQNILTYINKLPFGQNLSVARIVGICLAGGATSVKLPLMLTGQILLSDGTSMIINSTDELAIPNTVSSLADGVTPNTALFFANLNSFNVSVITE